MRRLHAHIWPHYPQPETDADALFSMHVARTQLQMIPEAARQYSEQWLIERQRGKFAKAVGVAIKALTPGSARRASNRAEAMLDAVNESIKAGIDIDTEADEVRRRMEIARKKA